jgi:3-methyladenine DNA glycosylase Tag
LTILKQEKSFLRACAGFDIDVVAGYGAADRARPPGVGGTA